MERIWNRWWSLFLVQFSRIEHKKKRTGLGTKDVWQKQEQTNISSIQKQLKPIEPWFDTKKTMSDMVFNSKQSLKHLHHNPYTGF